MKRIAPFLALSSAIAAFLTAAQGCAEAKLEGGFSNAGSASKVVVISIDGLRPQFYTSDEFAADAPNLRSLAKEGARATGAVPIFPTITYPNHATLATGRSSEYHGVFANTLLSDQTGPTYEWYWYESALRVPTLWQLAKEAGKTVAIIRWPSSVGAKVDWMLPEIYYSPGFDIKHDWTRVVENMDPDFAREVSGLPGFHVPTSMAELDSVSTLVAVHVLEEHQPDLTLVHLVNVDYTQHMTGTRSAEAHAAVRAIDQQVAQIVHAADLTRSNVVIVGDHGFRDYDKIIQLNSLFSGQGWVTNGEHGVTSWKVVSQGDGGHAAIYAKSPELADQAKEFLERESKGRYRIMPRSELTKSRAYPKAAFAVVAQPGYIFGGKSVGPAEVPVVGVRGHHGYSPTDETMRTGLIAAGYKIHKKFDLGLVRVLDVAPTVADLLGIPGAIPDAEGRPLPLRGDAETSKQVREEVEYHDLPKVPAKRLDDAVDY